MPITANSPLSSSVANDTFMDRTINTNTIGQLTLENTDTASGDAVANTQERINENSIKGGATLSLLAGDSITPDTIHKIQYIRVVGNGGAVTLADPFDSNPKDLTRILIVGTDDTNTVTFESDDVAGGLYINGNATLLRGYVLELIFDETLDRYIEIGRNF